MSLESLIVNVVVAITVVGAVVVGLRWSKAKNQRTYEFWVQFAQQSGLEITRPALLKAPKVSGRYKSFTVYLETVKRSHGKSRMTYTTMSVGLPIRTQLSLHILPEGLLGTLGKMLGVQDVQIGDPVFDSAFIIKTNFPQSVGWVLTPQLKNELLKRRGATNLAVKDGAWIVWDEVGLVRNPQYLTRTLEILVHLGEQILRVETGETAPS